MQEKIIELHRKIDTPALIVDQQQLTSNINAMQQLARANNVKLRPHIKTHKSSFIAGIQLDMGAVGISVAKVGEAEVMADEGITDIFIANQITHPLKLQRLKKLHQKISLSIGIDNPDQVDLLKEYTNNMVERLPVLIEIDSGLKRCGVNVDKKLLDLAKKINKTEGLRLKGIFTHAGQVYGAGSEEEIRRIGETEAEIMAGAYNLLTQEGIDLETVSVGSTPTVPYSATHPNVNEIRPGNYVFYDNIQYTLGSCERNQWSLYVLATVVSQPAADRIVIDAGSKALNLDRGAHATQLIDGYGRILNLDAKISRVSEEHGVIDLVKEHKIPIGSPVLIVPNHACAVTNLYSSFLLLDQSGTLKRINIDARGKSQ